MNLMNFVRYPVIPHNPDMKWCAFGFELMTQIATDDFIKNDYSLIVNEKINKLNEFFSTLQQKFPKQERFQTIIQPKEWENYKKFTGVEQKISLNADGPKLIISINDLNLSPSLCFKLEDTFLIAELHNAGTSGIAIAMWKYGLSALEVIYKNYGINTNFLPALKFEEDALVFEIPYQYQKFSDQDIGSIKKMIKRDISERDYFSFVDQMNVYTPFTFKGIEVKVIPFESECTSHKFSGRIKNCFEKNDIERSALASSLFILMTSQARSSYSPC